MGLYETDRKGSAPKMLVKDAPGWADVMPDGEHLLLLEDGTLGAAIASGMEARRSCGRWSQEKCRWIGRRSHGICSRGLCSPTEVRIDKIDLDSEKRETWQAVQPKNQEGAMLNVHGDEHHAGWARG